jgi:hypothetical protein
MKKTLTLLAVAAAFVGSVAIAPAASASGCAVVKSDYTMTVSCPDSAPGTQFQVVSSCPDGLRYSRWENQGNAITMQCQNIRLADIRFR